MEKKKQFKLVDSLNSNKMVRHIKACNWYICKFREKYGIKNMLDKHWKRIYTQDKAIRSILIINKREIWAIK